MICCLCQLSEHGDRSRKIDTWVGDTLAVHQLMPWDRKCLLSGDEIAFDHDTHERAVARANLGRNAVQGERLLAKIFLRIAVATIYHDS